jgi:hypothetical protein
MRGDERVRFCDQCSMNVYNLSDMTRREAEVLLTGAEGRLCVRFYRRADGTVMTNNCPVGLRAIKRRVSIVANAALSAFFGFIAGLGLTAGYGTFQTPDADVLQERQMMGAIAIASPTPVPVLEKGEAVLPKERLTVGRVVSVKRSSNAEKDKLRN